MCSIAIPGDVLLGHSPPSAAAAYGSLIYSSLMVTTPPLASRSLPPQIRPCLASASLNLDGLIRSGGGGSEDNAAAVAVAAGLGGGGGRARNKKRVVFADDRGRPLTQVRVMSEPSNMPPLWTNAYMSKLSHGSIFDHFDGSLGFLEHRGTAPPPVTRHRHHAPSIDTVDAARGCCDGLMTKRGGCGGGTRKLDRWEPCFPQPASDYLAFRGKLERGSVSLENVIVRESEGCLVGTVKVKNLAYAKRVTIRATWDDWESQRDIECEYVEQPGLHGSVAVAAAQVRNLYDTFRFRMELPRAQATEEKEEQQKARCEEVAAAAVSRRIEFCVRYRTADKEFWDNNAGANYVVMKKRDVTLEEQIAELLSACCGPSATHAGFAEGPRSRPSINGKNGNGRTYANAPGDDATRMQLRTWSEFASWQHLDNDAPYW